MNVIKSSAFLVFFTLITFSCKENEIEKIIEKKESLLEIAKDPSHEVQIIYSTFSNGENRELNTYYFNFDSTKYFYPASTVKFPVALLALQKTNELSSFGVNMNTHMYTGFERDSLNFSKKPNIADHIKKIFLVSDNDSYNKLYEFLGQTYINESLNRSGYKDSRIVQRLSILKTKEQNRLTDPVYFIKNSDTIYSQESKYAELDYYSTDKIKKGKGYLYLDSIVMEPFDFSVKNFFPLDEQHRMLISLFYPKIYPNSTFNLTQEQSDFVKHYMSMLPGESEFEAYNSEAYYDSFVKFFIYGDSKKSIPDHIKIYNKIGMAYGYLIDNAYIVDQLNEIEFFLSAVIHVNKNQIYNDGIYEYDEIGFPFLSDLGREIYNSELLNK